MKTYYFWIERWLVRISIGGLIYMAVTYFFTLLKHELTIPWAELVTSGLLPFFVIFFGSVSVPEIKEADIKYWKSFFALKSLALIFLGKWISKSTIVVKFIHPTPQLQLVIFIAMTIAAIVIAYRGVRYFFKAPILYS